MDRVETLCVKLQNQIKQRATVEEMLLTVQMIQSELMHIQSSNQQNHSQEIQNDINRFINFLLKNR